MTLPYERRRAIEWAGELLREIRQESNEIQRWGVPLPTALRELAIRILRHYPEPWQIRDATQMDQTAVCHWISQEPLDTHPHLNTELHRSILAQDSITSSTHQSALQSLEKVTKEQIKNQNFSGTDDKTLSR